MDATHVYHATASGNSSSVSTWSRCPESRLGVGSYPPGALSVGKRLADKKRTDSDQLLKSQVRFSILRSSAIRTCTSVSIGGRIAPWSCLRSYPNPVLAALH
jgi:hypothetical protein